MSDEVGSPTDETTGAGVSLVERYEAFTDGIGEEVVVIVVATLAVAVFPWLFAEAPVVSDVLDGYRGLATLMLIWAIFAIGFDLLLGYTGLLSFGHAAFWGGAAYAAGIFSAEVTGEPLLVVLAGTTFAVLFAWVLGFLSLRRGGIYFSILTLAFAQMLFYMASSPLAFLTNGENGFTSVEITPLLGVLDLGTEAPFHMLLGEWLYVFVAVFTVGAIWFAYRILNSPYGTVFRAIRENEQRAEFVGLNVWRYKLMSFVLSGAFAGVAGSLFTIHGNYVPLESLYWTESGEIVIMTVLGGVGSLFGPIFGAGVYLYVENIVSGMEALTIPFTEIVLISNFGVYWHILLGLVFVVVVVGFPRGIWGMIEDLTGFVVLAVTDREAAKARVRTKLSGARDRTVETFSRGGKR
ncbi:branched-chain amino acid ABC transporter permease [Salinirubrum litoreum]|uniref:Branched-chain amino acid ABC transporter permease n=1 Tax=Salinirubrum litoreum TaxID=1126234 RepID=A0ABD5R7B1_9EURY|nr:branched-chain amino acid ABC transporter permease [Salinirubrum litoreum]